ncbi:predicted protein [Histoplasma capsulatum var. duboisii H88]|uniref:Predicted protein n=1 Tax=Ajellomyces capsulatus (strain H88) TaxID=544711 RepID=F0URU0_AJEC8|nr:predicted protein [Histoplasma capsulatum var. duboisii H88]
MPMDEKITRMSSSWVRQRSKEEGCLFDVKLVQPSNIVVVSVSVLLPLCRPVREIYLFFVYFVRQVTLSRKDNATHKPCGVAGSQRPHGHARDDETRWKDRTTARGVRSRQSTPLEMRGGTQDEDALGVGNASWLVLVVEVVNYRCRCRFRCLWSSPSSRSSSCGLVLQLACVEVGEKSVVAVASGAELRVRLCAKKRAEPSSAATPFWALEERQPARYIPSGCGAARSHTRTQSLLDFIVRSSEHTDLFINQLIKLYAQLVTSQIHPDTVGTRNLCSLPVSGEFALSTPVSLARDDLNLSRWGAPNCLPLAFRGGDCHRLPPGANLWASMDDSPRTPMLTNNALRVKPNIRSRYATLRLLLLGRRFTALVNLRLNLFHLNSSRKDKNKTVHIQIARELPALIMHAAISERIRVAQCMSRNVGHILHQWFQMCERRVYEDTDKGCSSIDSVDLTKIMSISINHDQFLLNMEHGCVGNPCD